MSIEISSVRPRQHLAPDFDYATCKPIAIAWLVVYVFMVGSGLAMKPAAKHGAGVVVHAANVLEQQ